MNQNRYGLKNNRKVGQLPETFKSKTPVLEKEKYMKNGLMKQDQIPQLKKNDHTQSLKEVRDISKTRKGDKNDYAPKFYRRNGNNEQSANEMTNSLSLNKGNVVSEYEFRNSKSLKNRYSSDQHSLTPSLAEKKLRLKQLRGFQSTSKGIILDDGDSKMLYNQKSSSNKKSLKDQVDRFVNLQQSNLLKKIGKKFSLNENITERQFSKQKNLPTNSKIEKVNMNESISEKKNADAEVDKSYETIADQKIDEIRRNIKGFTSKFNSIFSLQIQSVYVDHTATNRPYITIENMIQYAKKFIANPHTEFSHFGKYSTQMMHYAHDSLLKSFNTTGELFVALPAGSGCTGAIQKTIRMLKTIQTTTQKMPNIFLTSYEHHSNILPWAEFYDKVQVLQSEKNGDLKLQQIQKQLLNCQNEHIIVSVSAASNVTSKLTPLLQLNKIIKRVKRTKKLLFCVDCAAYCCHHELDLSLFDAIDFVFLSPHKNLGGAQSSGVLLARKSVIQFAKPTFPGGGTARFVKGFSKNDVLYQLDAFSREIAGTPNFLGFYRAALSFELLHNIGYNYIHQRQFRNTKHFVILISQLNSRLKEQGINAKFEIYGDKKFSKRANVITFNLFYEGESINHNFSSLLYTDIFGIQLRSGCFCAGPLGFDLLQFSQNMIMQTETTVHMGITKQKPGFLRLDLTFYLELFEIQYIVKASQAIIRYSSNMEKFYTFTSYGEIQKHTFKKQVQPNRFSLDFADQLQEQLNTNLKLEADVLENREKTLQKQYKVGLQFMKNPIPHLQKSLSKNK